MHWILIIVNEKEREKKEETYFGKPSQEIVMM